MLTCSLSAHFKELHGNSISKVVYSNFKSTKIVLFNSKFLILSFLTCVLRAQVARLSTY